MTEIVEEQAFKKGDRFRFVKAHHSMNRILKARVGDEGVVLRTHVTHDGKLDCQVKFDESDKAYGLWSILAERLERI